mmetsp:Transcript_74846/g.173464  ORF Transcript_74846/g.173464 Transcript_74846/m.173464 type:complete len:298 (-) Transcript_74846:941-1834(-)
MVLLSALCCGHVWEFKEVSNVTLGRPRGHCPRASARVCNSLPHCGSLLQRVPPLRDQQQAVTVLLLRVADGHGEHSRIVDLLCLPSLQREAPVTQQDHCHDLGLEDCHLHTQADPRPCLEDRELVRWRCRERDPALRPHHLRVRVDCRVTAHRVGHEGKNRVAGHGRAIWQHILKEALLHVEGNGGVQAQRLVEQAVQHGHAVGRNGLQGGVSAGGVRPRNLLRSARLQLWVRGKDVEHPRERACSGVTPGNDEVQHHVPQPGCAEVLLALCLHEERQQVVAVCQSRVLAALGHELT